MPIADAAADRRRRARWQAGWQALLAIGVVLAISALVLHPGVAAGEATRDVGEAIYLRGVTGSGAALQAHRDASTSLQGAAAACVNCHRRSGFGGREGRNIVPPITGRYLFRPRAADAKGVDIPYVEGMRGDREPYTDATLARAIRDGMDSQDRTLSYLMPNYPLGDADMAALVDYLKRLDPRRVPGVTDTTLHFATIVTPDADARKRSGMLDVLKQFFADRNVRQMVPAPRMLSSGNTAYSKSMFMVHRRWQLHVWELTGPESGWQQQLERRLAAEPVLAVVSGLGGHSWAPVHAFCERAALPCLFPNVDAPVDREHDFYPMYFSKGVLLEAELIADAILRSGDAAALRRVRQVYRVGDVGEAGAAALTATLTRHGIGVTSQVLRPGEALPALGRGAGSEALVLWLRQPDVAALGPAPPERVYLSGLMAGLENAPLPPGWRERARLAYPFDLPERRRVRVDFALGWFAIRHIPVVDEQVQVDTYLACGLLSETLSHMVDTFVRDYLVERMEASLEHRIVTGYYPRLALATGQRFASKGGYVVRFADPTGKAVVADGDWTVP